MSTTQRVEGSFVGTGPGGINVTLGDLVLPRQIISGNAAIRQNLIDTLNLWRGEWFLNTSDGFPWAQEVLGTKQINAAFVGGLITKALLGIQGVATVTANASFNGSTRNFDYSFTAKLNNGAFITGGSGAVAQIVGG